MTEPLYKVIEADPNGEFLKVLNTLTRLIVVFDWHLCDAAWIVMWEDSPESKFLDLFGDEWVDAETLPELKKVLAPYLKDGENT